MSRIERAIEKATKMQAAQRGPLTPDPAPRKAKDAKAVGEVAPHLVTLLEPESPVSEEYRKLRSMVVRLTKQGGFKNTLMVTSALGGEGKSITALNLAVALSQEMDHTVLLIDADLRNPSLHRYLDVPSETGLADCLMDGLHVGATMMGIDGGHLSLLPAGKSVKNPTEILASHRMRELMEEVKHRYVDRYVILDTPPVLPFAETHSMSSMADAVLFVAREGVSSVENIRDSLDVLKDSTVLGIVYNDARVDRSFGNYYRYSYGYSRYAGERKG